MGGAHAHLTDLGRHVPDRTLKEAIVNAVFVADTMTGRDNHTWPGLPLDCVLPMLKTRGKMP